MYTMVYDTGGGQLVGHNTFTFLRLDPGFGHKPIRIGEGYIVWVVEGLIQMTFRVVHVVSCGLDF